MSGFLASTLRPAREGTPHSTASGLFQRGVVYARHRRGRACAQTPRRARACLSAASRFCAASRAEQTPLFSRALRQRGTFAAGRSAHIQHFSPGSAPALAHAACEASLCIRNSPRKIPSRASYIARPPTEGCWPRGRALPQRVCGRQGWPAPAVWFSGVFTRTASAGGQSWQPSRRARHMPEAVLCASLATGCDILYCTRAAGFCFQRPSFPSSTVRARRSTAFGAGGGAFFLRRHSATDSLTAAVHRHAL